MTIRTRTTTTIMMVKFRFSVLLAVSNAMRVGNPMITDRLPAVPAISLMA